MFVNLSVFFSLIANLVSNKFGANAQFYLAMLNFTVGLPSVWLNF